jgi:hypothetical protein
VTADRYIEPEALLYGDVYPQAVITEEDQERLKREAAKRLMTELLNDGAIPTTSTPYDRFVVTGRSTHGHIAVHFFQGNKLAHTIDLTERDIPDAMMEADIDLLAGCAPVELDPGAM